jgi:uncharacterized membrane protein YbaN (DUF454 family)
MICRQKLDSPKGFQFGPILAFLFIFHDFQVIFHDSQVIFHHYLIISHHFQVMLDDFEAVSQLFKFGTILAILAIFCDFQVIINDFQIVFHDSHIIFHHCLGLVISHHCQVSLHDLEAFTGLSLNGFTSTNSSSCDFITVVLSLIELA